jgi:hypothetical protein
MILVPTDQPCLRVRHHSPHVLQASTPVPTRMSCRPMMALTSCAIETCARVLGTGEPCCTDRPTRLFFMLEARGPQRTAGRVAAQSPPHREVGSGAVGHAVLWSPPSESRATIHVAMSEPTSAGKRVPEPLDT